MVSRWVLMTRSSHPSARGTWSIPLDLAAGQRGCEVKSSKNKLTMSWICCRSCEVTILSNRTIGPRLVGLLERGGEAKERYRTSSFVLSTLYPDMMAATKGNVGAVENMIPLPKFITVSRIVLLPRMIAKKGKC